MAPPRKHRDAILEHAVRLFREQGYAATGLNEIVAASGAPKGSLYHYFPGGKAEIGEAAVRLAGETVERTLRDLAAAPGEAAALPHRYFRMMCGWLAESGFRDGSPVAATLLETVADHEGIRAAGMAVYGSWTAILADVLERDGIAPGRAARIAGLVVSALEGALLRARVFRDATPLLEAADEIEILIAEARRAGPSPGSAG